LRLEIRARSVSGPAVGHRVREALEGERGESSETGAESRVAIPNELGVAAARIEIEIAGHLVILRIGIAAQPRAIQIATDVGQLLRRIVAADLAPGAVAVIDTLRSRAVATHVAPRIPRPASADARCARGRAVGVAAAGAG